MYFSPLQVKNKTLQGDMVHVLILGPIAWLQIKGVLGQQHISVVM
jgi:hypothetical protein